jgi:murein DD-endopeptidase MepM/ murein hydrolase activator NlpD
MRSKIKKITLLVLFLSPLFVFSDTADDLQSKIEERNQQIKQLEQEISQYNIEVDRTSSEAKTLQSSIKTLDLSEKKLGKDLSLTKTKIDKTSLTLDQLSSQIGVIKKNISNNKLALADMIRTINRFENYGGLSVILSEKSLGDIWRDIDNITDVQAGIKNKSDELRGLQADLEGKQNQAIQQKNTLVGLEKNLSGQKQAVAATKEEKSVLLTQTKNQEEAFRKLVADREAKKAQFEKELYDFESQLKLIIDPNSYPPARHGILSWPLDKVYVTQLFGKTVGSEKLYLSGSHNGVDFRASIGTSVKNVLSGTIVGTGNTDIYPGCYSFGKWVMVKHDNGLSTIYGHLSAILVSNGDKVDTGDIIGYSGNTGYSTGPHLHISVYATEGVRIEKYTNSRGCKEATIPLADVKAYLDPMVYFPEYK